jgi:hypothetical protein
VYSYDLEKELKKIILKKSYYHFFKWAFNILEPQTVLEDTFHIKYLCDTLQAEIERIRRREIKDRDIIINVPPRSSKSKILSQALLAWVWIESPHLKMIAVSYSEKLAISNSKYCKDIIKSDQYQELFSDCFQIRKDIDSGERFANDKGGERLTTTVSGSVTGFGAELVCLPAGQKVMTDKGEIDIKEIVENKLPVKILSFNHKENKTEYKEIISYQKNPSRKLVKITTIENKVVICTEDHQIWTENRGYVIAKELLIEDIVRVL